jgi:hypothetical protein
MMMARHIRSIQLKSLLQGSVATMERRVISPVNASIHVSIPLLHCTQTWVIQMDQNLKILWMRPMSEKIEGAINVERRVTIIVNAPISKPKKRRDYIQKVEDGYDPELDDYDVEDWFPEDGSHD